MCALSLSPPHREKRSYSSFWRKKGEREGVGGATNLFWGPLSLAMGLGIGGGGGGSFWGAQE